MLAIRWPALTGYSSCRLGPVFDFVGIDGIDGGVSVISPKSLRPTSQPGGFTFMLYECEIAYARMSAASVETYPHRTSLANRYQSKGRANLLSAMTMTTCVVPLLRDASISCCFVVTRSTTGPNASSECILGS